MDLPQKLGNVRTCDRLVISVERLSKENMEVFWKIAPKLGLMPDQQHAQIHGHRAAQKSEQHEHLFGNAELDVVELGKELVVNADHNRDDRHDGHVDQGDQ